MHYFAKDDFAEYYLKDAAINARCPENEADEYEAASLHELAGGFSAFTRVNVVLVNGKPFFQYMSHIPAVSAKVAWCATMVCHSTAENAPSGLVKLYNPERNFGKQIGAFPSILSIRIPMTQVHNEKLIMGISVFIVVFLSFEARWLGTNTLQFRNTVTLYLISWNCLLF